MDQPVQVEDAAKAGARVWDKEKVVATAVEMAWDGAKRKEGLETSHN